MRPFTIALQVLCAALGLLCYWAGLSAPGAPVEGGLLLGSLFLMMAAIPGADASTNKGSAGSRRLFKGLALLAMLPFTAVLLFKTGQALLQADWPQALGVGLDLLTMLLLMGVLAFDSHPLVRKLLRRRGLQPTSPAADERRAR